MIGINRNLGFDRYSGLYLWASLIIVFSIWQPRLFPTSATVHSVAANRAVAAMLALGVMIPLIGGVFDLAIGATANLATLSAVLLITNGHSIAVAVIVAILIGALIGAINGFIVVRLRVGSFIATLGMASVLAAVQIIVTGNSQPRSPSNSTWTALTQTKVLGFQIIVLYMLIIAAVLWWGLRHTPAGRYLYAIGSSPEAARLSGVRVDFYTWMSLIASGTLAGIAGVLYASLSGPSLSYGPALLLPAFAAVFLGSTQFSPGRYNVWGSILAIYVLATGVKGLQLVTDVVWLDLMFSGGALIAAVAVAGGRQRAGAEAKRRELVRQEDHHDRSSMGEPSAPAGEDGSAALST
ncbi:ABC transporter permease [uncultured Ilumatobacter sp.]|jgi:ribose transport system permease protein|uniref:ABC transporter permease n=1 Tax=uncultured Ilumatobacter sp. TaxID=879968 RepID=UPI00374E4E5E